MDTTTDITTDPRPDFFHAADAAFALVDRVRPLDLTRPTPCTEFDVRGLLAHIGSFLRRCSAAGRREDHMAAGDQEFTVTDDRWSEALDSALTEARHAWADDALLSETYVYPWATKSGADSIRMWTNEMVVHGWDLATALGVPLALKQDVAERTLETAHAMLPMADRSPMWAAMASQFGADPATFTGPFDNAVPTPDDASTLDRIVAWNGRKPSWAPSA